jgi:tetratricopeptide (TPR) repeat protein
VIDEMGDVKGFSENFMAGPYALSASPARYAVERSAWKEAAALEVRPNPLPFVQAATWFAKAIGSARSGDAVQAEAAIARLVALRDELREKKDAYWSEQVDIQAQVATAWLLFATGRKDEASTKMSAAADAEDKTEKSPVTPGPLAPARELYGAMLLEQGKAADALTAFEATLRKEPNRLNAILGAAAAADAAGDKAKAGRYFAAAAQQASDASVDRADVKKARAFVAAAK